MNALEFDKNNNESRHKRERSNDIVMDLLEGIQDNMEWIFSGIGCVIVALIGKIIYYLIFGNKIEEKQDVIIKQFNSGKNSTQIGIQNNYYTGEKDNE